MKTSGATFCVHVIVARSVLMVAFLLQCYVAAQSSSQPSAITAHIIDRKDGMVLQHNRPLLSGCGLPNNGSVVSVAVLRVIPDDLHQVVLENVSASVKRGCFTAELAPRAVMTSVSEAVTLTVTLDKNTSPLFTAHGVLFGHAALCRLEQATADVAVESSTGVHSTPTARASGLKGQSVLLKRHAWPCPPQGFPQNVSSDGAANNVSRVPAPDAYGAVLAEVSFGYPDAIPQHIHQTWSGYDLPCPSRWAEVSQRRHD
jgi:hypothetical protein